MNESNDPRAWIIYADEDYTLARSALLRKKPLTHGACFHAQQCAEKYLKAVLISKDRAFPKTHDLVALTDLCIQSGVIVPIDADALDSLSEYAVRVRYPGVEPTLGEAQEAMETAKLVRQYVRKLLG